MSVSLRTRYHHALQQRATLSGRYLTGAHAGQPYINVPPPLGFLRRHHGPRLRGLGPGEKALVGLAVGVLGVATLWGISVLWSLLPPLLERGAWPSLRSLMLCVAGGMLSVGAATQNMRLIAAAVSLAVGAQASDLLVAMVCEESAVFASSHGVLGCP